MAGLKLVDDHMFLRRLRLFTCRNISSTYRLIRVIKV